jgi:hypothetical protein
MRDVSTTWQKIALPDAEGADLYVEVAFDGGREEVGIADQIPVGQLTSVITGVARALGESLKAVSPSKAAVELGMEFAFKEGHLIARGTATANLKITLEWDRDKAGH